MPLIRDKILLNKGVIGGDDDIATGNAAAIQKSYENGSVIAAEIEQKGWLREPQALDFLARQEALCASYEGDYFEHHKHQRDHLVQHRTLVNDMRLWLDKKLKQQP